MIISEKQLLELILIAKTFRHSLIENKDFENPYGRFISKLLDEIRNQQSDELI